jgi:ADP-ribose pyrophosphatase
VLLLRQFRQAVGRRIWEIPAGTLEPGEQVLRCARRELAEETGYSARSWRKLTAILPSPGILDERLHLYAAWDLVPGSSRPEADEEIKCHWVPMARALAMVRRGSLVDAKSICALLYLSQFGVPGDAVKARGLRRGGRA